jgi:hypothetical protein
MIRKCGQIYRNGQSGEAAILAQTGFRMVCLICLDNGNRWNEPVLVENIFRINQREWESIAHCSLGGRFVLQKGKKCQNILASK